MNFGIETITQPLSVKLTPIRRMVISPEFDIEPWVFQDYLDSIYAVHQSANPDRVLWLPRGFFGRDPVSQIPDHLGIAVTNRGELRVGFSSTL